MVLTTAVTALAAAAKPSPLLFFTGGQRAIKSVFKFKPLFSSSSSSRKLILYSKPGCCLCDVLKEKLQAAFLISGLHSLHDVHLHETLPRLSSRLGVELVQKKIAAALREPDT